MRTPTHALSHECARPLMPARAHSGAPSTVQIDDIDRRLVVNEIDRRLIQGIIEQAQSQRLKQTRTAKTSSSSAQNASEPDS